NYKVQQMNYQLNDYKVLRNILFSIEFMNFLFVNNYSYSMFSRKISVNSLTVKKWSDGDSFPNEFNANLIQITTGIDMEKYCDINFLRHCDVLFGYGVKFHEMV